MSVFSEIKKEAPPKTEVVPRSAFRDAWYRKPKSDVCIGLRLIADDDLQTGRSEAVKTASRLHPQATTTEGVHFQIWAEAYNDALVRWIIARGTCDPNDVTRAWDGWREAPEDMVSDALTPQGAQFIFDAWERMRIATDITMAEATDEEIGELVARSADVLPTLERARAARVRRLLRFCLDELGTAEKAAE